MSSSRIGSALSGTVKKKLVIKPFKSQPQVPHDFEDQTWTKLQSALDAISRKTSTDISKEELCQAVEDACRHKLAVSLYAKLSEHCRHHINSRVDTLHNQSLDEAAFLQQVVCVWREHCDHMSTLRNIFIHLDRSYALETPGVRPVLDMGAQFFRLRFEQSKELEKKTVVSAVTVIERERRGFQVDRDTLRQALRMFTALGIYADRFEAPFIMHSRTFFLSDVQSKLPDITAAGGSPSVLGDFLSHVEMRLRQAADMCASYLDPSTKTPLTMVIEDTMLRPHISMLLQIGAHALFDQSIERITDIKRMYSLFDRVQATSELKQSWCNYIKTSGQQALTATNTATSASERSANDVAVVEGLIDFHQRMSELLKTAFHNLESFKLGMKSSFEGFFGEQETSKRSRPAELLCKFIDKKLCGGEKKAGLSEAEMEALLDRVVALFRFLQGQDAFEAFYKKTLSRRLLLETSTNMDIETSMIRKLKAECGANFTSKMEGMVKDVSITRDVIEEYAAHLQSHPLENVDCSARTVEAKIQVLTVGYWPTYPAVAFPLPPVLQASQDHFAAFYTEKYQGRRLTWVHFLSRCILGASYSKGKKEFDVPLSQAVVMMLFNADTGVVGPDGCVSYAKILQLSKLDEPLLKVILHTLACGPLVFRLLSKEPKSKEISSGDSFRLVSDYSNKLFRIRYKHQELKDSSREEEQTQEEIVRERHHCIDAAIVRIMKSRKRLSHQGLLSEAMGQLRFPCAAPDIKRRIETLIEREYLERDREDNGVYNYLA